MNPYWFTFLVPAVVLPAVSYLAGRRSPVSYYAPSMVQGRCLVLLIAGAAWGVYCLARLSPLTAASTLFATDPSCVRGTLPALKVRAGAPCFSEPATIVAAVHERSRGSYDKFMTLALDDGSRQRVGLSNTDLSQRMVDLAKGSPGMAARVQIFEGKIVAVATDEAVTTTQWAPDERITLFQVLALLGAGTFVAGLIEVIRSWRYLF